MPNSRFDRFKSIISHPLPFSQLSGGGYGWQPQKGDKVKVVAATTPYEKQLIDKEGVILKGCGNGIWKVQYPGKVIANLSSMILQKVE